MCSADYNKCSGHHPLSSHARCAQQESPTISTPPPPPQSSPVRAALLRCVAYELTPRPQTLASSRASRLQLCHLSRRWWRAVMREIFARHGEGGRGAAGAAAGSCGGGGRRRRWRKKKKVQQMPRVRAAAMRGRAPARRRRAALRHVLAAALRRPRPQRGASGSPGRRSRRSARIAEISPSSRFLNLNCLVFKSVSWCGRHE
jgi:hypothetical protein